MQRYFVENKNIYNNLAIIDSNDFHHIKNVMRMNISDKLEICDYSENLYLAEIIKFNKDNVEVKLVEKLNSNTELNTNVTIALGLTKQAKIEEVVKRITELGATGFFAVELTYSNVRLKNFKLNYSRLDKIVKEASEQSKRTKILKINESLSFKNFLDFSKSFDILVFAYEGLKDNNEQLLNDLIKTFENKNVLVLVGPEGGFTNDEVEILKQNKFIPVGLGRRILRLETAPLYILSAVSYELEL